MNSVLRSHAETTRILTHVFGYNLLLVCIIFALNNKKKNLGTKHLLLKHHISAQNEGKHVLAAVLQFFKTFW